MLYFKKFKNSKGQALIEAALIAPLIVFFLFTIIWFGQIMLTWQQLVTAARYGTDLLAYTPFSKEYIEQDIKNYLCHRDTIGRILDENKLTVKVKPKDYYIPSISFGSLNVFNIAETLKNFSFDTDSIKALLNAESEVEIEYYYKLPKVMNIIGRDHIKIKAKSSVLTGMGSAGSQKREK